MRRTTASLVLLAAIGPFLATQTVLPAEPSVEAVEFFERKIRPILADNCQRCHNASKQKANLSLESLASALKGGDSGPALVPGKPETSRLIKAIGYQDELRMPPRGKLTDEQITDLTAWVKMGAPWPESKATNTTTKKVFDLAERKKFWCWQPVKDHSLPVVKQKSWPQSPVDHFILAKLEEKGLSPAPPAEPRTLLRRLYFDLIGLPPSPDEVLAFEKAATRNPQSALAEVVDRLLASPQYGERWGRHWLDLVRFAETYGHEFDFDIPHAFEYRDYIIRAFNDDVSYRQLVLEHVAGDLLPKPRRHPTEKFNESIIGTGFWHLGEAKHSPVDIRGDEADRIDNQIDVFSKTFLGLTISCARCHDHKFDAITTKDYYSLYGFLSSSRYQRAFIDDPERRAAALRELSDLQSQVQSIARERLARLLKERADGLKDLETAAETFPALASLLNREAAKAEVFTPRHKQLVDRLQAESAKAKGQPQVVFEGFKKPNFGDWFVTGDAFGTGPARGELLHRSGLVLVPPGQAHSGLMSPQLRGVLRSPTFTIDKKKVLFRTAGKGQVNLVIDNFQLIRDPIYGGLTFRIDKERPAWHAMDVTMWLGHKAYIEVIDDGDGFVVLDRVLFADGGPPVEPPSSLVMQVLDDLGVKTQADLAVRLQTLVVQIVEQWQTDKLAELPDAAERVAILNELLDGDRLPMKAGDELAKLLDRLKDAEAKLPPPRRALALADGPGIDEHVFIRGNHKNLGESVPRHYLDALSPLSPGGRGAGGEGATSGRASGSGRLTLAERLVDPADPLVARVMVNRIWKHHFGEGIVRSVDNFGVLGEQPSHPELLDYLAIESIKRGWSIKAMHRLLLLSSTYQMASAADPKADEADPQNRLLHKMPIRRLESEAIRDSLLAVSGRLDRKMYGPGVLPHLTEHMSGRGRPASGPLDGDGRRSIYVNVRRNFLTPMFLAFDYPIPFTTIGKRSASNVPAQALTMLNNPFVLQQAERWGKLVAAEKGLAREKVTRMYETAFARPPSSAELAEALAFLQGRESDTRAWTDLAHVLFNVKEFIFVN